MIGSALGTLATTWKLARGGDGAFTGQVRPTVGARFSLACGMAATLLLGAGWWSIRAMALGPAYAGWLGVQVQVFIIAVAGAAVMLGAGVWLVRRVAQPVQRVLDYVRTLGTGDLMAHPMNSVARDEVGDLSRAVDKLAATLRDAVTELAISTAEVAGAAQQVVQGTSGTSTTMGEVAEQCASVAETAARKVVSGATTQAVLQASSHLQQARHSVGAGAECVRAIVDRGRCVGTVLDAMNEISARTRLVALNAAVEAARAGSSSRGFSTIAQEVQRLAERAQSAAERATAAVRAIEEDARTMDDRMARGAAEIAYSAELTGRAGQDLSRVAGDTSNVADAIQTLGTTVEEAGAGAAQSATAAAQLTLRTDELRTTLGRFKLDTSRLMPRPHPMEVETTAAGR